jgi:AAA15 family ATPase/GTPase
MIQEISIKNYLSFKHKQTISFEASSDKSYENYFCHEIKPGVRLLKLISFYGANASGKTNIIKAVDFLRNTMLRPANTKEDQINCVPFLLDKNASKQPSEFELVFYVKQVKYIYCIKLDNRIVFEESLHYYPGVQPALFFERKTSGTNVTTTFGNTLKLSSSDKKVLNGNTMPNSTVISAFSKSNIKSEQFANLYNWLKDKFMAAVMPDADLFGWTSSRVENSNNLKLKILALLAKADFGISDIKIEDKKIPLDSTLQNALDTMNIPVHEHKRIVDSGFLKVKSIDFLHKTENGDAFFPAAGESHGTLRYYGLGGILNHLLTENSIVAIDELENSLHPDLVNHFLKIYLVNSRDSQLIFTTHNRDLLADDLLRRDSIWLCEKDKDCSTQTSSVSDYSLHKNVSVYNSYKIGKLGGVPRLGDIFIKANDKKE